MKYLLMMIIALATISTATATSQRADCCGAKCCSDGHLLRQARAELRSDASAGESPAEVIPHA